MAVEDYLPLMGMAAGLLGGQQPGQRPNFASSLGSGLLGGLQGYQMAQGLGDDRKSRRLQELRLSLEAARAQKTALKEAAQQMALAKLGEGKSPEQMAFLQAAPDLALQGYAKQMFPEQMTPYQQESIALQRAQFERADDLTPYQAASLELERRRLAQPRDPGEMWSIVGGDQAKAIGLPEGTWQVSSRGQVKPLEGGGAGGKETWEVVAADDPIMSRFAPGTVVTRSSLGKIEVDQRPSGGGIEVFDPTTGKPLVQIGGPGNQAPQGGVMPLTTPTRNNVQTDIIGLQDQAARLDEINQGFKPDYLKVGPRIGNAITATQERLGMEVSPEAQADLGNFTTFSSNAISNLNQVLKEQSGAAVTTQEFERLQTAMPTAGTGIMDGDSPTQFQAKLKATTSQLKMAIARKAYLLSKGIPFDVAKGDTGGIGLEQMPSIIDAEGERIEQELIAKGVPPDQAQQQAAQQLKQTFGL